MDCRRQWHLFFTTPDAKGRSEIRLYEFATGGTKKKIVTVERSAGIKIAVSPDGRTILYPQLDEQGSDLMLSRTSIEAPASTGRRLLEIDF